MTGSMIKLETGCQNTKVCWIAWQQLAKLLRESHVAGNNTRQCQHSHCTVQTHEIYTSS
jgi:hypothetical protein